MDRSVQLPWRARNHAPSRCAEVLPGIAASTGFRLWQPPLSKPTGSPSRVDGRRRAAAFVDVCDRTRSDDLSRLRMSHASLRKAGFGELVTAVRECERPPAMMIAGGRKGTRATCQGLTAHATGRRSLRLPI